MKILRISAEESLLGNDGEKFVDEILQLADDCQSDGLADFDTILILQNRRCDDRSLIWLRELADQLTTHMLAARIERFRRALSLIRDSRFRWVFASRYDCFGSYWELALACQLRLWFSNNTRVGFPEITLGSFPPGGFLEDQFRKSTRLRDWWQQNPVINANVAFDEGLLDFCSEVLDFESYAVEICKDLQNVRRNKNALQPSANSKVISSDFSRALDENNPSIHNTGDFSETADLPRGWERFSQPWDFFRDILSNNKGLMSSYGGSRIIAQISSRHYLSREFCAAISRYIAMSKLQSGYCQPNLPTRLIYIDVNLADPHPKQVRRVLDAGYDVVLFGCDAESLRNCINSFYQKITVDDPVWRARVSWYQGSNPHHDAIIVRWYSSRKVVASYNSRRLEFFFHDFCGDSSDFEFLEWLNPSSIHSDDFVLQLMGIMYDGLISSLKIGEVGLPISMYLKSILIEEIVRISAPYNFDFDRVFEQLATYKWGALSSPNMWEDFLRIRSDNFRYSKQLTQPNGACFNELIWNASSLKSLKFILRKSSRNSEKMLSAASLSQHFALYISYISKKLASLVGEAEAIDLFCTLLFGFPETYGTASYYLRTLGQRRALSYASKAWPSLISGELGRFSR